MVRKSSTTRIRIRSQRLPATASAAPFAPGLCGVALALARQELQQAILGIAVHDDDADAPVHRMGRLVGTNRLLDAKPWTRSMRSSGRPPATISRREALARSLESSQLL
jgi:hypothetical protein